jgi:hypothetical protein
VPAALGAPEQVIVADPAPDGAPRLVELVYRGGAVRLDEFDGVMGPEYVKQVGMAAPAWTTVGDAVAVWIDHPHEVVYVDRNGVWHAEGARLAAQTLLWSHGRVTYRLEGPLSEAEAVRIADSVPR